eukprot:m.3318 g.3318  ORF g.3318 m.3318 type:complete len:55 (-) comp2049_c0_seq1:22-186(-)
MTSKTFSARYKTSLHQHGHTKKLKWSLLKLSCSKPCSITHSITSNNKHPLTVNT